MLFQQDFSSNINDSEYKVNTIGISPKESKPQKLYNVKNSNLQQAGSNSNSNNGGGGVYVDLGKALLEASKIGDSSKVQECITSGAPFITDWVNIKN